MTRVAGWAGVAVLFLAFLAWPLYQGRYFGPGQVVFYLFLAGLGTWWIHWTHRTIRVEKDRVVLDSPVRRRVLEAAGLRLEVRHGWWTRLVLLPSFGLPASVLRPGWSPDPEEALRRLLPPDRVTREVTPGIEGPGPAEEDEEVEPSGPSPDGGGSSSAVRSAPGH